MRLIIQRVKSSQLEINNQIYSAIDQGLVVFLGVTHTDTKEDADWLIGKMINMRIFSDEHGLMNLSVIDKQAQILLVSQFTLFASTKKGNRPGFTEAAKPEQAIPLYEYFVAQTKILYPKVETGKFGADMQIHLINDGPVTIFIDSKQKE